MEARERDIHKLAYAVANRMTTINYKMDTGGVMQRAMRERVEHLRFCTRFKYNGDRRKTRRQRRVHVDAT